MSELKPCPFCGGEATERDFIDPFVNGWVGCQKCHCFINWVKDGKPLAVAAWNRRAQPAKEPLTCEGCENEGKYEDEREYGYPSPCTRCKRVMSDNYRHPPERSENE